MAALGSWILYGLGFLALMVPVSCGLGVQGLILAFDDPIVSTQKETPAWWQSPREDWLEAVEKPAATTRRHTAATGEPASSAAWARAPLPDPKLTTTSAPSMVADDPAMLAIWNVLDDICDPFVDTSYGADPALACQTAGHLPGYQDERWCFDLSLRFHGHYRVDFDGSGRDQAMLVYEGCEATAGLWGGAVFVKRETDGWSIVEHKRHLNPSDCAPFERSDGSKTLACTMHYGRQDVARDLLSVVGLKAWDNPPPYLHDDVMHGCNTTPSWEGSPRPSEDHVYTYEATWRRFEGFESRQQVDGAHLIVRVGYALFPVTTSNADPVCHLIYPNRAVSRSSRYIEDPSEIEGLIEVEHLALDYLDDGEKLVPTPETLRTLERITKEGRGHLGLLEDVAQETVIP